MRLVRPGLRDRVVAALPRWIAEQVPRDHQESDAAFRKRRKVVAATALTGAGLLGAGLSTRPDSPQFYGLTGATAATWVVGGLASGKLHLGHQARRDATLARPVVVPVLVGAGAFAAFYAAALVARRIPVLDRAIGSVLQYAFQGSDRLVLLTTLANGAAEEVFFRGALYAAVGRRNPVAVSTGVYVLATTATRNPALVLASAAMGALFGLQRWASGGIQAPILTHLTWSVLMLRFLPPLFRRQRVAAAAGTESTNAASPSSSRSTSPSSM
ncbi:CPBP family intramembrane glutamic endopeptidase [Pseudonocardia lacus]|uniref:CPBP family intramembrane glutamic endopeptidase n=1 Tax=Pseudonocardia lacus TaxID=2835865 RepID=UPI001BDC6B03|nr:CPBP family intramembrane glutamic endopeptidase [Pseudonocardia lacus]